MAGRIDRGPSVTLEPLPPDAPLAAGEVVLTRWEDPLILHLVRVVSGERVLIRNNHGKIKGRVARRAVAAWAIAIR